MKAVFLAGILAAALPAVAQAHWHEGFRVGIGIAPGYSYCGPSYYYPAPVVVYPPAPAVTYAPPSVVYSPPVVCDPAPVFVGPPVVAFYGPGYYRYHHHHWGH